MGDKARVALLNPALLRLPGSEVVTPLPKAKVNVESQHGWESIYARFSLGLVEPEIPSETVTFQGVPVYNGPFGVGAR